MSLPVTDLVDASGSHALRAALGRRGFVAAASTTVSTIVLDSFDGRLHGAGLRLERRGDNLVVSGHDTVTAQAPMSATPRFAADLPPGPLAARLGHILGVRALLPLATFSTRTTPVSRRNDEDKIIAALRIHEQVTTVRGPVDGWFVEVDEVIGYPDETAAAHELVAASGAHALRSGGIVDVALAAAGVDAAGHRLVRSVPLDPDLPALDGFRLVLENLRQAIDANLTGTIDDVDPEFLHDLRVAVRRTRTVLAHAKQVLPADVLEWSRDGFRTLGHLTGPARDLDVHLLEWDRHVGSLTPDAVVALAPVHGRLEAERADAHRHLVCGLRSPATTELLERWRSWLAGHGVHGAEHGGARADRPIGVVVHHRILKAQRRLSERGTTITPATAPGHVHDLRKDAKQLRYLVECFGGLLERSARRSFVKRLKTLQDNLGEHQDAAVHATQLRRIVDELPDNAPRTTFVALGQLIEQLDRHRQSSRDAFAERFTRYDKRSTRRELASALDGVAG